MNVQHTNHSHTSPQGNPCQPTIHNRYQPIKPRKNKIDLPGFDYCTRTDRPRNSILYITSTFYQVYARVTDPRLVPPQDGQTYTGPTNSAYGIHSHLYARHLPLCLEPPHETHLHRTTPSPAGVPAWDPETHSITCGPLPCKNKTDIPGLSLCIRTGRHRNTIPHTTGTLHQVYARVTDPRHVPPQDGQTYMGSTTSAYGTYSQLVARHLPRCLEPPHATHPHRTTPSPAGVPARDPETHGISHCTCLGRIRYSILYATETPYLLYVRGTDPCHVPPQDDQTYTGPTSPAYGTYSQPHDKHPALCLVPSHVTHLHRTSPPPDVGPARDPETHNTTCGPILGPIPTPQPYPYQDPPTTLKLPVKPDQHHRAFGPAYSSDNAGDGPTQDLHEDLPPPPQHLTAHRRSARLEAVRRDRRNKSPNPRTATDTPVTTKGDPLPPNRRPLYRPPLPPTLSPRRGNRTLVDRAVVNKTPPPTQVEELTITPPPPLPGNL